MNKTWVLLGVGCAAGIAIGAVGTTYVSAQGAQAVPQITRTEILRKPLSGMDGKEMVVFLADIPPGGVAATLYHPGDEAIYMLRGALVFEPDKEKPFELKAGEI